jgi:hypothetical protein
MISQRRFPKIENTDIMPLPDIFLYNPTSDFAIANGTRSWQPNQQLRKMERDTVNLPQFLCGPEDIVLVDEHPSEQLLTNLCAAGFSIPEFRLTPEFISDSINTKKALGLLRPWGWSPEVHARLAPLKPFCSEAFKNAPTFTWKEEHRQLSSRQTAGSILTEIISSRPYNCLLTLDLLPVKCQSVEEVEQLAVKWNALMVKLPWSSSGRGLQSVTKIPLNTAIKQRIHGMLRDQGFVLAEPLLHKKYDLGLLYEADRKGIRFLGYSRFFTDHKGQYRGNFLNGYPGTISTEDLTFLKFAEESLPGLHLKALEKMSLSSVYQGPFGVDTLIYQSSNGSLNLQPCLEINWRYTMGHISILIEKHLSPGSKGTFNMHFNREIPFSVFALGYMDLYPLRIENGKIVSGFLPLTEYTRNTIYGAYLMVSRDSDLAMPL